MKAAHHRQAWRALWQRAREWLNANHALVTAAATVVLAVATAMLALATCSLVRISGNTDVTLHDTLVAANRAWVTPASAFIDAPAGNTGREPAINFVAQEEYLDTIDPPAPNTSLYTVLPKTKLKDVCAKTHAAEDGIVVYPSGLREYTYSIFTERAVSAEVQSGSKLTFVHGCFAYQTFQKEHKSEYCFIFLNATQGELGGANCPFGNAAN